MCEKTLFFHLLMCIAKLKYESFQAVLHKKCIFNNLLVEKT